MCEVSHRGPPGPRAATRLRLASSRTRAVIEPRQASVDTSKPYVDGSKPANGVGGVETRLGTTAYGPPTARCGGWAVRREAKSHTAQLEPTGSRTAQAAVTLHAADATTRNRLRALCCNVCYVCDEKDEKPSRRSGDVSQRKADAPSVGRAQVPAAFGHRSGTARTLPPIRARDNSPTSLSAPVAQVDRATAF